MSTDRLRLVGETDRLGLAAVRAMLDSGRIQSAWYAASTESTNTIALHELNQPHTPRPGRHLFLTDHQTGGRGRHGRRWVSSDQTLTFSLIVEAPATEGGLSLLSLSVGVAVATALEQAYRLETLRLKWPNDVYCGGGKLAGVLLETTATATDRVVVGIGINIGAGPLPASLDADTPAGDLSSAVGRSIRRYDCLPGVIDGLCDTLEQLNQCPELIVRRFRDRCWLSGKKISYQLGGRRAEGTCLGIADGGELIVASDGRNCRLRSGEVQLVRARDSGVSSMTT